MKGLTLTQPWASMMALGHKQIETRSWSTSYRGLVAIHAAKGFPEDARAFAEVECALGRIPKRIPRGAIIAVGELSSILTTDEASWHVTALERHLGDYSSGRFAWFFRNVRALPEPIPCRGALSLWAVPLDIQRLISEALPTPAGAPR